VKAMPEGLLSNHTAGTVKPGTIVRLAAPAGDFHLPSPTPDKLMFVTAGSGITPVMGMLRSLDRRSGDEPFPDVVHVHSVRDRQDVLFHDELRALERTQPGYTLHLRVTSEEGRIDAQQMSRLVPDWSQRPTWSCGPSAMLDELTRHFEATGRDDLYVERFTIDRNAGASGGTVTFGTTGRSVGLDGATTILAGGEQVGVQMPFGCGTGICETWVVGLEEGHVRGLRNGTDHSPGERIQTCVSVACGDVELKLGSSGAGPCGRIAPGRSSGVSLAPEGQTE